MIFHRRARIFIYALILLASLSACEIINPDDPVPSYVYIENINTTSDSKEGTAQQKFTDAWVYKNQDLVGTFELPALIPVIAEGKHTISVKPGIELNGIASTRAAYPFMKVFETQVELEKEKIDTINNVKTSYYDNVNFPWATDGQEDFEQGGISLDSTANSDVSIKRTDQEVFEGSYSGHIKLDSAGMIFELENTNGKFDYPGENNTTFLELHYKIDNKFTVGIKHYFYTGKIVSNPILTITPTSTWNKIYVNLTPTLTRESKTTKFKILFSGNVDKDMSQADIYLDNIKLVTSG